MAHSCVARTVLGNIPPWVGQAFGDVRAGPANLTMAAIDLAGARTIRLSSPAFAHGARLPVRFTVDGEGTSPPLVWGRLPEGAQCLALVVEDPAAPASRPFVHAIVAAIDPALGGLPEGALCAGTGTRGKSDGESGRNSYLLEGWLPPDPPGGHGEHNYVFQLFALLERPRMGSTPGRAELRDALDGRVIGAGILVGTYSRGEPDQAGAGSAPAVKA